MPLIPTIPEKSSVNSKEYIRNINNIGHKSRGTQIPPQNRFRASRRLHRGFNKRLGDFGIRQSHFDKYYKAVSTISLLYFFSKKYKNASAFYFSLIRTRSGCVVTPSWSWAKLLNLWNGSWREVWRMRASLPISILAPSLQEDHCNLSYCTLYEVRFSLNLGSWDFCHSDPFCELWELQGRLLF